MHHPTIVVSSAIPAGGGLAVSGCRDPQRRWTSHAFTYASYHGAELGYAVTDHTAQGRTIHTGLAVITAPKTARTPTSP